MMSSHFWPDVVSGKGGSDMAKDAPGMKGYRSRNDDGELRRKRGDTHLGTIEDQYGRDFGVRRLTEAMSSQVKG